MTPELSMTTTFARWLALVMVLCGSPGVIAETRPLVVELFTAQGCSSCPPADAFLGQLSERADVVALGFHVDYWDKSGWRDRFSLPQSTERQHVYAKNLHHATVFTPEIVVDGRFDAIGADATKVKAALAGQRTGVPLNISLRESEVLVDVGAQADAPRCDVLLVAYLRHAVSAIGRGENAGRTLEEFNIVRQVRPLGAWKGEAKTFQVPLASLAHDATDVAVLIQPSDQGPMVGATAHALR
jgi:hypothetical protein